MRFLKGNESNRIYIFNKTRRCPKKKAKPRTREDVAKAGIALYKKKHDG